MEYEYRLKSTRKVLTLKIDQMYTQCEVSNLLDQVLSTVEHYIISDYKRYKKLTGIGVDNGNK